MLHIYIYDISRLRVKAPYCDTHIQHSSEIRRGQITSLLGLRTWGTLILWKIQTFLVAKNPFTLMLSYKIKSIYSKIYVENIRIISGNCAGASGRAV